MWKTQVDVRKGMCLFVLKQPEDGLSIPPGSVAMPSFKVSVQVWCNIYMHILKFETKY